MAGYSDVQKRWLKVLEDLDRALDQPNAPRKNTEGLMTRWGAMMVEVSQRAFLDQRLGDVEWPPRYPGMEAPIINIAGALSDFNDGRSKPKPNRFQDRPAAVDEGMRGGLWGSVSFRAEKTSTEAGSNKPYAGRVQNGGRSTIRISEEGYRRGRDWLVDKKGNFRSGREGYFPKLWPALFRRFHKQTVLPRPFVGITDELAKDMIRETSRYFERESGLGGGRVSAAV